VLGAGWKMASTTPPKSSLHFDELLGAQVALAGVELAGIRQPFAQLIHRIRHAGIPVSDRRAVKLQRVIAASALLSGRAEARLSDLWVVRHIWDTEEQQEVLASLVDQAITKEPSAGGDHPRARSTDGPDAESVARDLDSIEAALKDGALPDVEKAYLRDRLGILEGRCQWVKDGARRDWLLKRAATLWPSLKTP